MKHERLTSKLTALVLAVLILASLSHGVCRNLAGCVGADVERA